MSVYSSTYATTAALDSVLDSSSVADAADFISFAWKHGGDMQRVPEDFSQLLKIATCYQECLKAELDERALTDILRETCSSGLRGP